MHPTSSPRCGADEGVLGAVAGAGEGEGVTPSALRPVSLLGPQQVL